MVWLTEGKKMKIYLFVLTECIQERDRHTGRQTDGHRMTAKAALAQHRAAKNGNKTAKINANAIALTSDGVLKIGQIRRSVSC